MGFQIFCSCEWWQICSWLPAIPRKNTFVNHNVLLSEQEMGMNPSSKIVVSLVQTMKNAEDSIIYADNYFTSYALVKVLLDHYQCIYTRTARKNCIRSDMLVYFYKTPLWAHRWYIQILGYLIDICVCNEWLLYKRKCVSLKETLMPLRKFWLKILQSMIYHGTNIPRVSHHSSDNGFSAGTSLKVLKKGQKKPRYSWSCEVQWVSSTYANF